MDNLKKKRLKGIVKCFFVDFNSIDFNDILDILKYLMKKIYINSCLGSLKMFMVSSVSVVTETNH